MAGAGVGTRPAIKIGPNVSLTPATITQQLEQRECLRDSLRQAQTAAAAAAVAAAAALDISVRSAMARCIVERC
jgi:hypothetical protein